MTRPFLFSKQSFCVHNYELVKGYMNEKKRGEFVNKILTESLSFEMFNSSGYVKGFVDKKKCTKCGHEKIDSDITFSMTEL